MQHTCTFRFVQIKGAGLFWGPIRGKIRKILINVKKIFFSRMY